MVSVLAAIFSLIIVSFIVYYVIRWMIRVYNLFINKQQNIKTQWSNVLTEYQRRADILYNLTQTVKYYAKFEKSTMTDVIQARSGHFGNGLQQQQENVKKMDDSFSSMLSRLMVVVERYPKLKAIEEYERLSNELKNTENRINEARTYYNQTVRDYNGVVLIFPNKILASLWSFKEQDYYAYQAEAKENRINLE
jgi:LemA protein